MLFDLKIFVGGALMQEFKAVHVTIEEGHGQTAVARNDSGKLLATLRTFEDNPISIDRDKIMISGVGPTGEPYADWKLLAPQKI